MEVNPDHAIVTELRKHVAADKGDKTVKDPIWLLFDTSLLTSGCSLDHSSKFASCIHGMQSPLDTVHKLASVTTVITRIIINITINQ